MKTFNKVLETMLSKPATPRWTTSTTSQGRPADPSFEGPTQIWSWGG